MLWLEWMCDYPESIIPEPNTLREMRLRRGRMVLATASTLEQACYSAHPHPGDGAPQDPDDGQGICGICDKALRKSADFTGLSFDATLYDNAKKKV
jgi:hypothetical protein